MAKEYSKKKLLYLGLAWGSLLISVFVVLLLYFLDVRPLIISIVIFVLSIYLLFILFYCKTRISFYDLQQRYQLLLDHSLGCEQTSNSFDNNWLNELVKKGFHLFISNGQFAIYFRINKSIVKKTFYKTHVIEIIAILKNNSLDFYADALNNEYKQLWVKYEKEYRLNKQVIIQVRKYTKFTEEIKTDLDRIISYREGDNYLVTINCGYFESQSKIYYLHSDKYYPNTYYRYAVDTIKDVMF